MRKNRRLLRDGSIWYNEYCINGVTNAVLEQNASTGRPVTVSLTRYYLGMHARWNYIPDTVYGGVGLCGVQLPRTASSKLE
jgi:hypothetical protein